MNVNDLIANYIVELGIKEASEFNRTIFLNELEKTFDEPTFKYIKANVQDICNSIKKDERVGDLNFDDKGFDMVFYWDCCLDNIGKDILYIAQENHIEIEYEEVIDIATDIFSNYDYSDYNDYIKREIDKIKDNDEKLKQERKAKKEKEQER